MPNDKKPPKSEVRMISTATEKGLKPATNPPPMPQVKPPKSEK